MDKFRCLFCGDEATETDSKDKVFVVSESAAICERCLLQAVRQVAAYKAAEREYLSWGNDGKEEKRRGS